MIYIWLVVLSVAVAFLLAVVSIYQDYILTLQEAVMDIHEVIDGIQMGMVDLNSAVKDLAEAEQHVIKYLKQKGE